MEFEPLCSHSHLFAVRLWLEPLGDGQTEWCGKVQYFRDWPALLAFLEKRLPRLERKDPADLSET